MDTIKCPQIENLQEITPDLMKQYIQFVAHVRHTQRRYFALRRPEILEKSKVLEQELDALNEKLLNPTPKLF